MFLAFFCGLSTIRYVLNFIFPVTISAIYIEANKKDIEELNEKIEKSKKEIEEKLNLLPRIRKAKYHYIYSMLKVMFHIPFHISLNKKYLPLGKTSILMSLFYFIDKHK